MRGIDYRRAGFVEAGGAETGGDQREVLFAERLGERVFLRFEAEQAAFHERVRQGYLELARGEPGRFRVVDAAGAEDDVGGRVWDAVRDLSPSPAPAPETP